MPTGYPRQNCKICERHRDECGDLSKRGKCMDCARAMQAANIAGIQLHDGPFFRHWRRQMAASVGGRLLDEIQQRG